MSLFDKEFRLATDVLGKRFIRSEVATGNFKPEQYGLKESDFQTDARLAFNYIKKHQETYGSVPTEAQLTEKCALTFLVDPENPAYVADLILERNRSNELDQLLRDAAKALRSGGYKSAYDVITTIKKPHVKSAAEGPYSFVSNREKHFQTYLENKGKPSNGIKTPWESVNKATEGLIGGEFWAVMAEPAVGKSWFSCVMSNYLLSLGETVLLVPMEMSSQAMTNRITSLHYQIPFVDIRRNDADVFLESRWQERVDEELAGDIIVADESLVETVPDIDALVEAHKPTVVIVDGGYRLKSTVRGTSWEQSSEVVESLQSSCKASQIPWVVTTQANLDGGRGDGSRASKVRYTKEWFTCPHVLLELSRNEDQRFLNQMQINMLKVREATEGNYSDELLLQWDLEYFRWEEIHNLEDIEIEVPF